MSSDDEYYHDGYDYRYKRRSSKRPRRRGSSPRRHRHLGSDYLSRKSRRSRVVYTQIFPRLAGLIILIVLIVYEVLVLKGAASRKNNHSTHSGTSSTTSTRQVSVSSPPPTVSHIKPQSHQNPVSPPSSSSPASTSSNSIPNDSKSSTAQPRNPLPSTSIAKPTPVFATSNSAKTKSSESTPNTSLPSPNTKTMQLPESAIKQGTKGADEDPDTSSLGNESKLKSSQTATDSSGSSTGAQHATSQIPQSDDKGAEPGAGENFWNWFQETKGSDQKGAIKTLPCPEENKRLCQMFYKYIRKYKIRRIFDVSCEKNFEWMAGILKKAGNELWGFKYYCSLWEGQRAGEARNRLQGLPFVEFDSGMWWRSGFAQDTELLFAWDTLPHLAYGRVWNFFVKARKQDIKYILVDNYPGILNDPSPKHDFLNLRKHPFRFPSAKEVAQNVTEPGETAKRQLLFYETSMLPENLQ